MANYEFELEQTTETSEISEQKKQRLFKILRFLCVSDEQFEETVDYINRLKLVDFTDEIRTFGDEYYNYQTCIIKLKIMANQQTFFQVTPEIRSVLKEEIENHLATTGRTIKDLHSKNKHETGFPVSWQYIDAIVKNKKTVLKAETVFVLLEFFGYTLKSFIFSKSE